MVSTTKDPKAIVIQEALPEHVPSLSTMDIRAFHPHNSFHRKVFPNTPTLLDWWSKLFLSEIADPTAHVLIALDSKATDPSLAVAGVICMRFMNPSILGAGIWTMYDYTPDHDFELFKPSIDVMVEWREKLFKETGQWHYLLEFVGVDEAWKGTGVGRRLLERACEIADERGVPVFVEGNQFAVGFYKRCGFEERGSVVMGGQEEEAYRQHVLVRGVGQGK